MCPINTGLNCDFAGIFTVFLQIVVLSLRTCMDAIMVPPVFALRGSADATDQVIALPLAEVRHGRASMDGVLMGQTRRRHRDQPYAVPEGPREREHAQRGD